MTEIQTIQHSLSQSSPFKQLLAELKSLQAGQKITVEKMAGSMLAFVLSGIFEERQGQILVISGDNDRAEQLRDDCIMLNGQGKVLYFGERTSHTGAVTELSSPLSQIETLQALTSGVHSIIIASPRSIAQKVPAPKNFLRTTIDLSVGGEYKFQQLPEQLITLGFEQKNFVEGYGDFAVRGGILDIFSFVGENPLRFEFWGDTIESIREFDVLSQRSIKRLERASVIPSLFEENTGEEETTSGEAKNHSASLFDYLKDTALVVFDQPEFIEREFEEFNKEGITNLFTGDEIVELAENFPIIMNTVARADRQEEIGTIEKPGISFGSTSQPSFNGSVKHLIDSMMKLTSSGYSLFLSCDTKAEKERLSGLLEDILTSPDEFLQSPTPTDDFRDIKSEMLDDISHGEDNHADKELTSPSSVRYTLITGTVHSGFVFPEARLALYTEHELFGRLKRRGGEKRKRFKGFSQKEVQQLKPGDYVVHVDRGIGMFSGMQKIVVAGVEQEVMRLAYDEGGIMYVNLQMLNRVQKYSSKEGYVPKLNRLGSGDWEKITSKAKKRIKDIARDLIKLYAKRKLEEGYSFAADSHWQKELEASFMYEDTPDQARTTLEVKQDMESKSPMDRLVCGDVGFGKTEIAIRAAFKAVSDGKQVAILVPTTILAMQHYNTFLDRLSNYAVKVEHLTRFKSTKEQKVIVDGLKSGAVDIIIGTHRLLSKDMGFKDLGLLIIDEEHRFGVSAKEKLKSFRASVDTLALTATPIPRTLQFSLLGARDLSIISTPPQNRLPIQTEIIPAGTDGKNAHWMLIREAIVHELHRGGQIYVVHDRVENIDTIADMVRSKVPEAKVHVAHGQMAGHELEQTILDFLEKKYDVLVCTKIIESGLDIPSVNTIIVNRADRFGMAELHQLRGRVGRSNVQAFAYLLTPPLSVLPKPTLRRLQAIGEFTELGSGFNLSMRDLEIRGAGNLLGAEQSGFVADMGFEMYEQILRQAVEELKQEEFNELFKEQQQGIPSSFLSQEQTIIETDLDAYIPEFYIESAVERLDFYRRLSRAITKDELNEMRAELKDRFGEYPDVVEHLFYAVELRILGTRARYQKIEMKGEKLTLTLPSNNDTMFYGSEPAQDTPFQRMIKIIGSKPKGMMKLVQEEHALKIVVRLTERVDILKRFMETVGIIHLLNQDV